MDNKNLYNIIQVLFDIQYGSLIIISLSRLNADDATVC